jgi:hypothetical protein
MRPSHASKNTSNIRSPLYQGIRYKVFNKSEDKTVDEYRRYFGPPPSKLASRNPGHRPGFTHDARLPMSVMSKRITPLSHFSFFYFLLFILSFLQLHHHNAFFNIFGMNLPVFTHSGTMYFLLRPLT